MAFWAAELMGVAGWIWHDQPVRLRTDTVLFFSAQEVPAGAEVLEIHTSACGRYALHVDSGKGAVLVGRGPARGDWTHTSLDSYGVEVGGIKAVKLWALARFIAGPGEGPMGEMHPSEPGWMCVGIFRDKSGKVVGRFGTDGKSWLACEGNGAIGLRALKDGNAFFAVGQFEEHASGGFPADWLSGGGASAPVWRAAKWKANIYFKGDQERPYGGDCHAWVMPRELPQMEAEKMAFAAAYRMEDLSQAVKLELPLKVKAGEKATLLLDAGTTSIGYPVAGLKGKGAAVTLEYAEVLYREQDGQKRKTFAPATGATFSSILSDRFAVTEERAATFQPFHWRAFRFVKVEIEGGETGAEVTALHFDRTGYPFDKKYEFAVEGEQAEIVQRMLDVSWQTLKCCAWETYMDCPYYEQLQYVGDTRIQVLLTYVATGDPALPVQALRAFDRSRIYEGLTQSRYPCTGMQLIPTFSLIYILMLEDYLNYVGDEAVVAELRPGIASVLNFFGRLTDPVTGLITKSPYWDFVDWVEGWPAGVPAGPVSSIINLLYLLALQAGSRLYEVAKSGSGELYAARAKVLAERIYDAFFDPAAGVLHDTPRRNQGVASRPEMFSQQAQTLAVLGDVLKGSEARRAMELSLLPTLLDVPMKPASFYFRFYVAEALAKLKMGAAMWKVLEVYRDAIAAGSTTWPESLGGNARSECHAWGSWPMYFFARHVLGVAPPDLADGSIRVDPLHVPPLENVAGTVVTHRGEVRVKVRWVDGKREVEVDGPPGVFVVKQ